MRRALLFPIMLLAAPAAAASLIECELTRACHADMECQDIGPLPLAVTEDRGAFAFATPEGPVEAELVSPPGHPQLTLLAPFIGDRIAMLSIYPSGLVALTGHGTATGRPDVTTLFGTCATGTQG